MRAKSVFPGVVVVLLATSAAWADRVLQRQEVLEILRDLTDQTGSARATLGTTLAGDPNLVFFDDQVKKRTVLRTVSGRALLGMYGAEGRTMITMMEREEGGGPGLRFYSQDQKPRAVLELTEDRPGLILFDTGTQRAIQLGLGEKGSTLAFRGKEGKEQVGITESEEGLRLFFSDVAAQPRVELDLEGGAAGLAFLSPAGKPRLSLGTDQRGGDPKMKIFDPDGDLQVLVGYAEVPKSPEISFYNKRKKSQMMMMLADEMPFFMLMDKRGESLFQVP